MMAFDRQCFKTVEVIPVLHTAIVCENKKEMEKEPDACRMVIRKSLLEIVAKQIENDSKISERDLGNGTIEFKMEWLFAPYVLKEEV